METARTRIELFSNFMKCIKNMHLWEYDSELKLLNSGDENDLFWGNLFLFSDYSACVLEHCNKSKYPLFISNPIGLLWIAVPLWENGKLQSIFLLGPVFLSTLSSAQIDAILKQKKCLPHTETP